MTSSPDSTAPTVATEPPVFADVEAAAGRLAGKAVLTPLLESPALNERLGARLLMKAETLQRTGSFKFRGAYNRISQLSESCTLYADDSLDLPETRARVRRLPFAQVGKQVSKLSVASGALAAMLKDSGMFPVEALETAVETFQSPSIAETNKRAISAGLDLV